MSKFSTWVCFCMDLRNLIELASSKLRDKASCTFSKDEDVLLLLEELSHFFVDFDELWLQHFLRSQWKESNILNKLLPLVDDTLSFKDALHALLLLSVREPNCHKHHANNLRNKAFDIAVAMTCLLVKSNVFVDNLLVLRAILVCIEEDRWLLLSWRLLASNQLIDDSCDGRILNVDNVEAGKIVLVSKSKGLGHRLTASWLRNS